MTYKHRRKNKFFSVATQQFATNETSVNLRIITQFDIVANSVKQTSSRRWHEIIGTGEYHSVSVLW